VSEPSSFPAGTATEAVLCGTPNTVSRGAALVAAVLAESAAGAAAGWGRIAAEAASVADICSAATNMTLALIHRPFSLMRTLHTRIGAA